MISVMFTAKYFGVSVEKDAWVLAYALITNIVLGVWGPINEIFRAKFVHLRELNGEDKALSMTRSLISFIVLVTFILTLLLALFSHPIGGMMASKFTEEGNRLFVSLFLSLLPLMLINELSNIGTSILNAYEIYYIPEIVSLITGLFGLAVIILFADSIGIFAYVISAYFGAILLLLMIVFYLRKVNVRLWKISLPFNWKEVKVFLLFALPFFFPYFVGQLNSLNEKYLSGLIGEGNISSLDYSRQFMTIIQSVLSSVLTTVMVPMLAKYSINKDGANFLQTLRDNIKISFLLGGMAVVMLVGATQPLCEFFFLHGKVTVDALALIVSLTKCFGLSLLGIIVYLLFGMSLLSSNQSVFYAKVGVINQIVVLVLNLSLINRLGLFVFPLSIGVVHAISGFTMLYKLNVEQKSRLFFQIIKSVFCILILSVAFYLMNHVMQLNSSFYWIVINAALLLLVTPLLAEGLGIRVLPYIKQIYYKYGKK
jgi:peptidoglycan biosynthesis protein MviN/MurJ (putative lipid II flippase)